MRNNKKGFTLIELLAVIVILAIIALIATPIVLQIIEKARRSAAQDSLYGVMSATKTTYMESLLDTQKMALPAYVECDKSECKVYHYKEDEATGTLKKGDQQVGSEGPIKVKFSGTVPGGPTTSDTSYFIIGSDGKILDTVEGDEIQVNGFSCTIKNEGVTCK